MGLNMRNSGSNTPKEEVKDQQKQEVQKVEAAAAAAAPTYDQDILYSKSDTIAFVAPLGDPSKPDVVKDEETGKTSTTPYIVGYRFKALADMEVPDCGLADDCRKNLMSFVDKNGRRQVKAGEIFDLTRFETGLLLAAPEFNGKITGEGKEFTAVFQLKVVTSKTGKLGQASSATKIPTVALKAGTGSIKDYDIIEVLKCQVEKAETGAVRKFRTINPGFEKWEPLCRTPEPRVRGTAGTSSPRNTRNQKAQAFLDIVAKK